MVLCIFFRLYIGTVIIDAFVLLHLVDIYLFTKKKTKWWEKRLAFSTIVVFIRWKGLQNLELVYAISIVDFKTMFIDIKKANFFFISFSFRWQYFMALVWGICCSWKIENDFQIKSWKTLYSRYSISTRSHLALSMDIQYTYIYFISSTIHGYGIKIIDDKYEIKSLLYFCYHVRISTENSIEFLWFIHSLFRNLQENRVEKKGE